MDNNLEKIEVNYKNKKRYKTARYPLRQPRFFTWLIWALSKINFIKKNYKIEKINMDGLKPPYIILSNHMHFIDFKLAGIATYPHRVNNVCDIVAFFRKSWIMRWIGGICTRRYTSDLYLIKSIMKVIKRGDVVLMYPEAKYSADGTPSYIPTSVAKLVKKCKVPVVIMLHQGNHLHTPFWNWRNKRKKVPLCTKLTQILTSEQIEKMTVQEIDDIIQQSLEYDEYKYQKENKIVINSLNRAEGLHKILYQCPHCLKENKMNSKGTEIFCEECGKRWNMKEDGSLEALNGETEFSHIPDWYEWERLQVRKQIEDGTYYFEDDVDVYSLPRTRFIHLGNAKVKHTIEGGFVLEGFYNGEPYRIIRKPLWSMSLHVEYDYEHIKPFDCFDITTEDDSYYCFPQKKNVLTKLNFATEEIYQYHLRKQNNK